MSSSSSSRAVAKKPAHGRPRGRHAGRRRFAEISRYFNPVAGRPASGFNPVAPVISACLRYSVNVVTSTVAFVGLGVAPTLSSFDNYSQYTALFDQYWIQELEVWVEPIEASQSAGFPVYASAVDLDDANTPTTLTSVSDKQGSLEAVGAAGRYHRWKPHMALAAYSAGTFGGYANAPSSWCDAASPQIQHYGFKLLFTPGAVALTYQLSFRALVSFRRPGI